ncbi:MAG: DUF4102 domain-containing protein [Proteobacteria bacterium]|nr:DUF4102 domain-containing protein [Pseudomonadota bacterium]
MALTAVAVRQAKPREKPYKLFDARGLFLLINPTGSKLWRIKYKYAGKEKQISFGHFPDVSLVKARDARADARRELTAGVNPSAARKAFSARLASNAKTICCCSSQISGYGRRFRASTTKKGRQPGNIATGIVIWCSLQLGKYLHRVIAS